MEYFNLPIKDIVVLQWGHVFSDVGIYHPPRGSTPHGWASMGPRLFRRGNLVRIAVQEAAKQLQWGHVFSDVGI